MSAFDRHCLHRGCPSRTLTAFTGWVGGILMTWWMCEQHAAEYPPAGTTW